MYTSGIGAGTKVWLGIFALLALFVAAMGALQARPATAADGEPVLVYGGTVSGSGAAALNIAPNANGNYVVSMTVPTGEEIEGIHVHITYNQTLFSSVTCPTERDEAGAQFVCNPDADPSNTVGELRVVAVAVAPAFTGTVMLATVNFSVAGSAPTTANAISAVEIRGCSATGAVVTCQETPDNLRALSIGTASTPEIWGNVNCSATMNAADANLLKRAAAGLAITVPDGCTVPTNINCTGATNAADANLAKRMAAGLAVVLPENCPPPGYVMPPT